MMFLAPQPMHIPDGFLSIVVDVLLWIAAIIAVGYSLKRVEQDIGERQVPLMGVLAAAIFAGQMLNFTVAGGRRDIGALDGGCHCHHPSRALGCHFGHDQRRCRAGTYLPGRRVIGFRR
jgi:hypothetical protein